MDVQLANMQLSTALHGINGIIYEYNLDTDEIILQHNASGYPAHEFTTDDHRDEFSHFIDRHVHPDDAHNVKNLIKLDLVECFRNNEIHKLCEFRRIYTDGRMAWKSMSCTKAPQGNKLTFILQDITEQKENIEKMKETEQQVFTLVSSTFNTITEFNRDTLLLHTIVGAESFTSNGIIPDGTLDDFYESLKTCTTIHPSDRLYILEKLSPKSFIEESKREPLITFNFRLHGEKTEWYEVSIIKTKRPGISLCSIKSIEDVKAMLEDDNNTDRLTGLNSADSYRKGIFERYRYGNGRNVKNTLIVIDIDDFNLINENKGRVYGDVLLCRLAAAIKKEAPEGFSARIGGDEFAVVLENADCHYAQRIVDRIRKRFRSDADETETFSAGIAEIPPDGSIRELHNQALSCVVTARTGGGNRTEIYSSDLNKEEIEIHVSDVETHCETIIATDVFQRVYLYLSNCEDPMLSLPQALGLACSEYDISHAFIYRITDEKYHLELISQWYDNDVHHYDDYGKKHTLMDFLCCEKQVAVKLLDNKTIDAYSMAKENPVMLEFYQKRGIFASLICPCSFKGKICAIVGFDEHQEARTWSEEESTQLSLVADLIGKTVEREFLIRNKEVPTLE